MEDYEKCKHVQGIGTYDDNRLGYAHAWEQAKILKEISDKLRKKDVPVPEVKLVELWWR